MALSSAAPPLSAAALWQELSRQGLLGAAPAAVGPVGQFLTHATRQGLLECVTRLDASGKQFEDWSKGRAPMAPEQVVDFLEREPARFDPEARVAVQGFTVNAVFPLTSLEDVRRLDAVYGVGAEAESPELQAARLSVDDLAGRGWKFRDLSPRAAYEGLAVPLSRGGYLGAVDPATHREFHVEDLEHVAAVNYFYGSGLNRGLVDPTRATAARQLLDEGYVFRDLCTPENSDLSFAYHGHDGSFAGHPGQVMLPFDDAASHDLDTFKLRVGLAESVCRQIFASGLAAPADNDTDWYVGRAIGDVLQADVRFGYDDRAQALVTLAVAELRRQPKQALYQIIAGAHERFQRVDAVTRSAEELQACSAALAEMIAAAPPEVPPSKVVDDTVVSIVHALMPKPSDMPTVERGDDCVVIGGVRIPRRRDQSLLINRR